MKQVKNIHRLLRTSNKVDDNTHDGTYIEFVMSL